MRIQEPPALIQDPFVRAARPLGINFLALVRYITIKAPRATRAHRGGRGGDLQAMLYEWRDKSRCGCYVAGRTCAGIKCTLNAQSDLLRGYYAALTRSSAPYNNHLTSRGGGRGRKTIDRQRSPSCSRGKGNLPRLLSRGCNLRRSSRGYFDEDSRAASCSDNWNLSEEGRLRVLNFRGWLLGSRESLLAARQAFTTATSFRDLPSKHSFQARAASLSLSL